MGIAIYFYHIARLSKKIIYKKYAEELIDEIYDEISTTIPLGFENGLAGIGWGIEYLAKKKFIADNTNEILIEFDNVLAQEIDNPNCKLIDSIGIGFYFLKRMEANYNNISRHPYSLPLIKVLNTINDKQGVIIDLFNENFKSLNTSRDNSEENIKYLLVLWFLCEFRLSNINNKNVDNLILVFLGDKKVIEKSAVLSLFTSLFAQKILQSNIVDMSQIFHQITNNIKFVDRISLEEEVKLYCKNTEIILIITRVYQMLFSYTRDEALLTEVLYWQERCNNLLEDLFLLDLCTETHDLGIYKGIAGIGLINQNSLKVKNLHN
jgi:hypothetical protein